MVVGVAPESSPNCGELSPWALPRVTRSSAGGDTAGPPGGTANPAVGSQLLHFAAARFADFLHLSLSVFPLFCLYSSPRAPSSFLLTTSLLPTLPLRKAFFFKDHPSFPSHLSLLSYHYFFFSPKEDNLEKAGFGKRNQSGIQHLLSLSDLGQVITMPSWLPVAVWPCVLQRCEHLASHAAAALSICLDCAFPASAILFPHDTRFGPVGKGSLGGFG